MDVRQRPIRRGIGAILAVTLAPIATLALGATAVVGPNAAQAASPVGRVASLGAAQFGTVCPPLAGRGLPAEYDVANPGGQPLNQPTKITADDAGNVYVVDSGNRVIRKYEAGTFAMSVVAGGGQQPMRDDLPATQNALPNIGDIEVSPDGTTLYLITSFVVRAVDLATGTITTSGGVSTGAVPVPTDGSLAAGASLGWAVGLALLDDRLYVMSQGFGGEAIVAGRVFAIQLAGANQGTVSTVAGSANVEYPNDRSAAVRNPGGVLGTETFFNAAYEIEADPNGGLIYFVSGNGRILDFDPLTGTVHRTAGSPSDFGITNDGDGGTTSSADFTPNLGLAFRDDRIIVAQSEANRLRMVSVGADSVTGWVGDGRAGYRDSGGTIVLASGLEVGFARPSDITQDAVGNIYVADTFNNAIRLITNTGQPNEVGVVSTISGEPTEFVSFDQHPTQASNLRLQDISGLAADNAGGYYIADNASNRIYYVDPYGSARVFAGNGKRRFAGEVRAEGEPALTSPLGAGLSGTGYIGKLRFAKIGLERYLYLFEGYDSGGSTRLTRIAIDQPGRPLTTIIGNGGLSNIINEGGIANQQGGTFTSYAVAANGDVYLGLRHNGVIFKVTQSTGLVNKWAGAAAPGAGDFTRTTGGGNRLTEYVGLLTAIDVAKNGDLVFSSQGSSGGGTMLFRVGADNNVAYLAGIGTNSDIDSPDGALGPDAHLVTGNLRVDSSGQVYLQDQSLVRRYDPTDGRVHRVMGSFDGNLENAAHTLGASIRPALSAASTAISDFDISYDGTMLVAEDHRFSGDTGAPSLLPLGGSNRIRRLIPGANCLGTPPIPPQNEANTILLAAGAWDTIPDGDVYSLAATPDFSHIVYASTANEGDPTVVGRRPQVYLYERGTGKTTLINVAHDGQPDRQGSNHSVTVSAGPPRARNAANSVDVTVRQSDGHVLVAFDTDGALLPVDEAQDVANGGVSEPDVYVRDVTAGTLTLVSTDSAGVQINGLSPRFSPDGQSVAFVSKLSSAEVLLKSLDGSEELTNLGPTNIQRQTPIPVADGYTVFVRPITEPDSEVVRYRAGAAEVIGPNGELPVASDSGLVVAYRNYVTETVRVWRHPSLGGPSLINFDTDPNKPAGNVAYAAGMNAAGTKLAVEVINGTQGSPWLVDLTNPSAPLWTRLDAGATPVNGLPLYNHSRAAIDQAGRRVAFTSVSSFPGLPIDSPFAAQIYLRDLRQVSTLPSPAESLAAVPITTAYSPGFFPSGRVRTSGDGTLFYWSNGELIRRAPDGTVTQLTTDAAGPHPHTVAPDGTVYWGDPTTGLIYRHTAAVPSATFYACVTPFPTTDLRALRALAINPANPFGTGAGQLYAVADGALFELDPNAECNPAALALQLRAGQPGDPYSCSANDGPTNLVAFCNPGSLDFDAAGNAYIVEGISDPASNIRVVYASRIRNVELVGGGTTTTLAGSLDMPFQQPDDGVDARTSGLSGVYDLAVDSLGENVYFADGFSIWRVRNTPTDRTLQRMAGQYTPLLTPFTAPVPALSTLSPDSVTVNKSTGDIVFGSFPSGAIGALVSMQIDLTSPQAGAGFVVTPGVSVVPTKFIPSTAINPPPSDPEKLSIEAVGIGSIDLNDARPGELEEVPLGEETFAAIPLARVPLARVALESIPLARVGIDLPGGWEYLLAGTPLEGKPLQSVSVAELLDPALNTNLGTGTDRDFLSVPLARVDLSNTPLARVSLAAISLAGVPLARVALPSDFAGSTPLEQWCNLLDLGIPTCADLGIDPLSDVPANESVDLVALQLSGVPLARVPLARVPLARVDLQQSPLARVPLARVDMAASPLARVPLARVDMAASPLARVPLARVDFAAAPLARVPLARVPLARVGGDLNSIVNCSLLASPCDERTLGEVQAANAFIGGDLATLVDVFDETTLGDIKFLDPVVLGDLLAYIDPELGLSLADVLMGLISLEDYPWEQIDVNSTADMREAAVVAGGGGVAGPPLNYEVSIQLDGAPQTVTSTANDEPNPQPQPFAFDGTLDLALPPGYGYVKGSAVLRRSAVDMTPIVDPVRQTSGAYRFSVVDARDDDTIAMQVVAGLELGSAEVSATLTGTTLPLTSTATLGSTVAGEWEEPNNTVPTARQIQPDSIYFGHLASSIDVDLYKVTLTEGQTMSAILSNLPADFDLTMYAPPAAPLAGRTGERLLVPVPDEPVTLVSDPTAAPAEPADDLALEDGQVYAVAQRRDRGDERIDTGRLRAGTYYLKVTGFNGSASTKPYALRVTMETPITTIPPCATWSFVGDTLNRGSLPVAEAYTGANTIFVIDRERLFGKYPTTANSVMTALTDFVNATDANPTLGVRAVVVPIDGAAAVRTATQNWESGTNRCDPLAARNVASAIAVTLDGILAANPTIQNVVIVGGDDIVPFGRVPDTTRLANEREFAQELDGNDELVAAARGGWVLTDDVYVDRAPIQVGSAELYVPNVALGRLVETPNEIVGALADFVTFEGNLDATSALSVGYDFLTDGANAVKSALTNNGLTTDANAASLIGDAWSAQNLKDALLGQNGFTPPDIASVNAHFDDYRALPADENTSNSQTNLFTTSDLPDSRALARSLLFSVGCHSGLNVADGTQSGRGTDWAQSYARQGAIWLGNTGFGYGDTEVVAASEKLMALFAEQLNGKFTTGQALLLAKQGYVADLGDIVTAYDIKVSQQMTFYGLPMYRLHPTPQAPDPAPAPAPVTTDVRTGLDVAALTIVTPLDLNPGESPGTLEPSIEDRGTYYTVDGDALTVQNRPIQPRTTRDVTRVSSTAGTQLGVATGMLVTGLTSVDHEGVNPAVFRPIVDSSDETEPATVENVFPAAPVSIGRSTGLATVGGQTTTIERQQVVAIPGQFRGGTGDVGTQRLFPEISGIVYYATVGNTDTAPPTIRLADAVINGGGATFTIVTDDDGSTAGVKRVYILATPSNPGAGEVTWFGTDLTTTGNGAWTGGITVPEGTTSIDYLVQVVDSAGNVGVSSNKGVLYQTETAPDPEPQAPAVTFAPAVPSSGWLGSSATITATDPSGLDMSYTIDGGENTPYTAPFTVAGSGAHEIVVRNTAGLRTVIRIPIDQSGPSTQCAAPPSSWSGTDVSVPCVAADDGVGLNAAEDSTFTLTTAVADDTETANASTGTRQVCDALGSCSTVGPVGGIKVDRKAPSITLTSPVHDAIYAEGQVVNAAFSCADSGSGVASCAGTVSTASPINTATPGVKAFTVSSTDAVGNVTSRTVQYAVSDAAPPVIDCSAVPVAWSATNVTIACTATDGSGLANPVDASFTLSTNVAAGTETATASTPSRTVCDTIGNCSIAGPFTGIKVDRRAPTIAVTAPANGATYSPGQIVNAAFSCNEGGSGEVSCVGTVAVGTPIDTGSLGAKSFTVTSVDAVGNSSTTTVAYTVASTNAAPTVRADMGVAGLQEIGFQTGAVTLTGSFTDADGPGPYTASVRWTAGGPFTPLILNTNSQFATAWLYASAGARTVTVRICDAAGSCGTDDVIVRTSVTQRITPSRCVVDLGSGQNPRYRARFSYNNPATFAIYVPTIAGLENTFTSSPALRGQPQVFKPGANSNVFSVAFQSGSMTWRLNATNASASPTSPRC